MAFGDILGTKLNYQRNPDGSTSSGEIPGLVSSLLGNPVTYQRSPTPLAESPAAPVSTPVATTPGATRPASGFNAGTAVNDYNAQLESIKQQALDIQSKIPGAFPGEQTVGQAFGFSAPEQNPYGDPKIEAYLRSVATTPVDEQGIQQNQLALFQAEIDAVNAAYDQMVNQARLEGEGRLGSQRAIAARGGILGSDFAGAQKDKVLTFNRGIEGGIQAERAARIGSILGTARKAAADEIAAKNTARQQGAESYLSYLANAGQRKQENLTNLAQSFYTQGVSPDELDEGTLSDLARQYGTSTEDIVARYYQVKDEVDTERAGEEAGSGTVYSTSKGLVRVTPDGEAELIFGTGGGTGGSTGVSFTNSERKKLEQAGLSNAPRQDQLDFLYGDEKVSGTDEEQIRNYLNLNRNQDPELLKQDLLSEGYPSTLVNSFLGTRPLSDIDISDFAQALVQDSIEPKLLSSREKELDAARAAAIQSLTEDFESGRIFDLFGERSKQLTPEEYNAIIAEINTFTGSELANKLIDAKKGVNK